MPLLLDTVTLSEFRKITEANPSVSAWEKSVAGEVAHVSVITINEIHFGIRMIEKRDAPFARKLGKWLQGVLAHPSRFLLLPVDVAVARKAADYRAIEKLSYNDSLIAATAHVHDLVLATRNVEDFEKTGIQVMNPWDFGK